MMITNKAAEVKATDVHAKRHFKVTCFDTPQPYAPVFAQMKARVQARAIDPQRDTLDDEIWLLEHPPVYTRGLHKDYIDEARLPYPIVATNRGGKTTFHGIGQAVIYPMIDIKRLGISAQALVYRAEDAVIALLQDYAITGMRLPDMPGVYVALAPDTQAPTEDVQNDIQNDVQNDVQNKAYQHYAKISAVGFRIHQGLSYHGIALNIAMDCTPFDAIDPCGYAGLRVCDMRALMNDVDALALTNTIAQVKTAWLTQFIRCVYGMPMGDTPCVRVAGL